MKNEFNLEDEVIIAFDEVEKLLQDELDLDNSMSKEDTKWAIQEMIFDMQESILLEDDSDIDVTDLFVLAFMYVLLPGSDVYKKFKDNTNNYKSYFNKLPKEKKDEIKKSYKNAQTVLKYALEQYSDDFEDLELLGHFIYLLAYVESFLTNKLDRNLFLVCNQLLPHHPVVAAIIKKN